MADRRALFAPCSGPRLYTIPPEVAFLDALAGGLIAAAGPDPQTLARMTVLLPNRRSSRALGEAFLRQSAGRALLLPCIGALGDVDDHQALGLFGDQFALAFALPVPPPPQARRLALARRVWTWLGGPARPGGLALAHRLAAQLERTLEALFTQGVAPERLLDIAQGELARHWQSTLDFLRIALEQWPLDLAAQGWMEPAERRVRLLHHLAEHWRTTPPPGPVLVAGITTVTPATKALLRTVAHLPHGALVLPGLDQNADAQVWAAMTEAPTHPQQALAHLLDTLDATREDVRVWPGVSSAIPCGSTAVTAWVQEAFLPARFTARWARADAPSVDLGAPGCETVRAVVAATSAQEARLIALALRRVLEVPEKRAALITPDRTLARRVAAELRRWGLEIDDSAGKPLAHSLPATLLLALAECVAEQAAPVALLTLLKHPLCQAEDRAAWLAQVRLLDKMVLRGPRPRAGLEGLDESVAASGDATVQQFWRHQARPLLASLLTSLAGPTLTAQEALDALITAAEVLCPPQTLWRGEAGEALAQLLADLRTEAVRLPAFAPAELPGLLNAWLLDVEVRPSWGGHPRLAIWGLLEARLQRPDLVILGGLNEGIWPQLLNPDPWLSPGVRKALGLPATEERIGQSAHDFVQALGAPEVLLTRARKQEGTAATPSRFWRRLEAALGRALPEDAELFALEAALEPVDSALGPQLSTRPAPVPSKRPPVLSVTDVERLKSDPYHFYARQILRLAPLDPVDAEPSAAERGTEVHAIFEAWGRRGADPFAPQVLLGLIADFFAAPERRPLDRVLWQPRLERAAGWVIEERQRRAGNWRFAATEAGGKLVIDGVTLRGRADWIERDNDGQYAIIDFKTGRLPTWKSVNAGFSPQLALLAMMLEAGALKDEQAGQPLVPQAVRELWLWRVAGTRREAGKGAAFHEPRKTTFPDPAAWRAQTRDQLQEVIARYLLGNAPFIPKLHPDQAKLSDYTGISRENEWQGRDTLPEEAA